MNFDWHNDESNKRNRSPNYTTNSPPHTKTRNKSKMFISTHHSFTIDFNEELDMDAEVNVELKKPPLPPPILKTSPLNYVNLHNNLK